MTRTHEISGRKVLIISATFPCSVAIVVGLRTKAEVVTVTNATIASVVENC